MALLPQDWIRSHKKAGIQPVISNPSRQAMHLLTKAGIPELIGEQFITVRVNDAVLMCQVCTLGKFNSQSRPGCRLCDACWAIRLLNAKNPAVLSTTIDTMCTRTHEGLGLHTKRVE